MPDSGRPAASFGSLVDSCFGGTIHTAAGAVVARATARSGGYVCFCNVHLLVEAHRRPAVRAALADAAIRFPDGAPVAWLRRRTAPFAVRVGGPDVFPLVLKMGTFSGLRHFFFGATEEVLDRLQRRVKGTFPDVQIAGAAAPPFAADLHARDSAEFERLRDADPDIAWVGLGAPKQEMWMHRFARQAPRTLFLGVGAAFDFHAGMRRRAPAWMSRAGLEWLHRLGQDPVRLAPRYVSTNSAFIAGVIRERVLS